MATFLGTLNGSADSSTAPELTDEQQRELMAAWAEEAGLLPDPGNSIDVVECPDLP